MAVLWTAAQVLIILILFGGASVLRHDHDQFNGVIQTPNRLSPFRDMEAAMIRRNHLLDLMAQREFVTVEEATIQVLRDETVKVNRQVSRRDRPIET